MASVQFWIEISGKIDTLSLWKLIEQYKVNLTAIEDKTWIYGEICHHDLGSIIERCSLYGSLKVEISKGGVADEQKKAKEDS